MLYSRMNVLFTLRTLLNAIVCCLQLNTGRGTDVNRKVDYLGIDACWIAVYVLCRNAQMNLIVDTVGTPDRQSETSSMHTFTIP